MLRSTFLMMLLIGGFMFIPAEALAQGCAMCKAVVESGEPGVYGGSQSIGAGLNKGILYLMAVPYVLLFLLFRKRIVGFVREFAGVRG